jgi:DNA primase
MTFTLLQFGNATQLAPDSENTTIPEKTMTKLKSKFKDVIVVFDNDNAGITSSKKYEETFNVKSVNVSLDKDLADCVKNHGVAKTRHALITSYKQKYGEP